MILFYFTLLFHIALAAGLSHHPHGVVIGTLVFAAALIVGTIEAAVCRIERALDNQTVTISTVDESDERNN